MSTAAGDLATEALGMGLRVGVVVFAGLIAAVAAARALGLPGVLAFWRSGVLAFWLVYILTRPLGASLGDLLT